MGCAGEVSRLQRLSACLREQPRVLVLMVVGIAMFGLGVSPAVEDATVSLALVVIGAGTIVLGVLVPVVGTVEIGPGGFRLQLVEQERDASFQAFVTGEYTEQLRACAAWLTCDAERAAELVKRVLVDGYIDQPRVGSDGMHRYLLCRLVQRARADVLLHGAPAAALDHAGDGSTLCALDFEDRLLLVLRHREALSPEAVAAVVGWSVDETRIAIEAAEIRLQSPPLAEKP